MFDEMAIKEELSANEISWKYLRDGLRIGHFSSTNATPGFGPAQIYVKHFAAKEIVEKPITIFLLHDLCQYHGRFMHFIDWMRQRFPSISFVAMDFVGHGLSSGTRGHFEKFDYLVNDFHQLLKLMNKKNGERWIGLGHGLGGLVLLDFINRFQTQGERIDGLILSNFIFKFQSFILQMDDHVLDEKNFVKKIISLTRPSRFNSGKEILSDPVDRLSYDQDPLIVHRPTLKCVKEIQRKMQTIYQDAYFIDRPVLLLRSEGGQPRSLSGIDYFAKGIKKDLMTEKKYSLLKHDLYNERERELVYSDILSWIKNYESSNEAI